MTTASGLLRWQFRLAHGLLESAIDRQPLEAVRPRIRYAGIVVCEDVTINGGLADTMPLALSAWAGRTGLSEIPPLAGQTDWSAWEGRVRVDLDQVRAYAGAVYAVTDAFLAGLAEEALDPAAAGAPARLLSGLLLTLATRRGELTAV